MRDGPYKMYVTSEGHVFFETSSALLFPRPILATIEKYMLSAAALC